ncbi:protein of unknown function [Bradyrhizobium sp. ORS 285]|uniref:hypothetical protein n=1 Tax=Bradyrhizobium sp. ORS 285 TaxID=115808 RepID=UPI000240B15A|nr:hypothetical protein [Bradyrhizobium sp. ORS 285]CCD84778.1 hypothetical protein BRAO285_1270004 [Bradyrhizobium sp. ORS 285]SMX57412.1 protein of unknown function [Bradyrhizobium sp. ORS 285]
MIVDEGERTKFGEWQDKLLADFAKLAPGEDELLASFKQLAMETYGALTQHGLRCMPWTTWPESAAFFRCSSDLAGIVPETCLERWRQWELGYPELLARHPRLELRNLMQTISERMNASSWPYGYEWAIEAWIAGGDPDRAAFGDRVLFERLAELHTRLGGWLYLDDDYNVVFETFAEFRQTGRRREKEREDQIRVDRARYEAALHWPRNRASSGNRSE